MRVIDVLKEAIEILNDNEINEPIIKSRILLADLLKIRKEELIFNELKELEPEVVRLYMNRIYKLCEDYPLQYIIGRQEFMGYTFEVNENVLIPRNDTEILVEEAFKYAHNDVLELCTGSGAIAISLAKKYDDVKIVATDISNKALEVARNNAYLHEVDIDFLNSDLFENVQGKYDLIIANPPYIETEKIKMLEKQVRKEPLIALDGGKDGLFFYRRIAVRANDFLKNDGYMCLEIGYNQKKSVIEILKGKYDEIKCIKDLSGNDRVIVCKKKG